MVASQHCVVAQVVPYEGAEMVDDADVWGREQRRFLVHVAAQLFSHTQNTKVVAEATRASEDRDSACPLDKKVT